MQRAVTLARENWPLSRRKSPPTYSARTLHMWKDLEGHQRGFISSHLIILSAVEIVDILQNDYIKINEQTLVFFFFFYYLEIEPCNLLML